MAFRQADAGGELGHAVRRADSWESPPAIGWLKGSPAAKSDPQGGAYQKIGPGSSIWENRKGAKTTGDQRKR